MKVFLILLYVWKGSVALKQVPAPTLEACKAGAPKVVEELQKDPRFDGGLYATCLELPAQEAQK